MRPRATNVRTVQAGFPRRIQLQTHNRCNYRCGMCPYPQTSKGVAAQWMSEGLYRRILEQISAQDRPVALCLMLQNEPLIDRRFVDWVTEAHAIETIDVVATVTNGSLLDHELLDRLTSLPKFHLNVSINSTDRKTYLEVHGRDNWTRVERTLSQWRGPRHRVTVSSVIGSDTVDRARDFREHWEARGYETRLLPYSARAASHDTSRVMQEVDHGFGFCAYPVETLTVRWDGVVLMCCQDWKHEHTFGSLQEQEIADLWNGEAMARLRGDALAGTLRRRETCRECDYPMRSAARARLDRKLHRQTSAPPRSATHPHASYSRDASGQTMRAAVYDIDPENHILRAFVEHARVLPAGPVETLLSIGFRGEFAVERPTARWCGGRLEPDGEPREGMLPVRIELDPNSRGFEFFAWYAADWRQP